MSFFSRLPRLIHAATAACAEARKEKKKIFQGFHSPVQRLSSSWRMLEVHTLHRQTLFVGTAGLYICTNFSVTSRNSRSARDASDETESIEISGHRDDWCDDSHERSEFIKLSSVSASLSGSCDTLCETRVYGGWKLETSFFGLRILCSDLYMSFRCWTMRRSSADMHACSFCVCFLVVDSAEDM